MKKIEAKIKEINFIHKDIKQFIKKIDTVDRSFIRQVKILISKCHRNFVNIYEKTSAVEIGLYLGIWQK